MVYLDSNVFLYASLYDASSNAKARAALRLIDEVADGKVRATSSILAWDEVVWVTWKLLGRERAFKVGSVVIRLKDVRFVDVSRKTILKAEEICQKYELRPRDAIHAATAILEGEREVITEDDEFDKVREIRRVSLLG